MKKLFLLCFCLVLLVPGMEARHPLKELFVLHTSDTAALNLLTPIRPTPTRAGEERRVELPLSGNIAPGIRMSCSWIVGTFRRAHLTIIFFVASWKCG